ncbi:hypothetical protein [Subtercola endophyticus]|uniref:hypothetical protein n=1 Tax=Subtercola endophyticus TaxID=2895559 RepID=UPI001E3E9AAC|nr:hypothetical protein [Subtercola endophyticus]UFS59959.1 hypothetical protein LQ955_04010 [Subtercola endophyticus]
MTAQSPIDDTPVSPRVTRGIDRVLSIHRPVVLAHIRGLRKRHPGSSPQQLITILERHYLTAVTSGGAAVGATSVIPAVGTGTSLALTGVETLGFLEASALFAQSITEVHGIAVENPDRARALVMTLMMGSGGVDLVQQLAKQVGGGGVARTEFWGTIVARSLPAAAVGPVADQVKKTFLKHLIAWTGSTAVGRLMPFGIGAVIGGAGNNILGRRVVKNARTAFGPAPVVFPVGLEQTIRMPESTSSASPSADEAKPKRGRVPRLRAEKTVPKPSTVPKPPKQRKPPKPPRQPSSERVVNYGLPADNPPQASTSM